MLGEFYDTLRALPALYSISGLFSFQGRPTYSTSILN